MPGRLSHKGWDVHTVYDLAGVSGKAVMEHSEAKRMLKDMHDGKITGLIFSKLARLARNTKELLEFSEEFREAGADLISLQESIDTGSPSGRFFFTLLYTKVEPIVDEGLWDTCFQIVQGHRHGPRQTRKTVNLFSGYAYCACGAKMYVWSHSPTYRCGKCRRKIPIQDLEAIYRNRLGAFLVSPDEIEAHNKAATDAVAVKEKLVSSAETELKKLTDDAKRMMDLYLSGGLSKDEFARHHNPLAERRAQLEDELPRLQASLDVLKIDRLSRSEAANEATNLASHWDTFTFEDKRSIIEAITENIIVGDDEVAINLLYRPDGRNSDKMATQPSP